MLESLVSIASMLVSCNAIEFDTASSRHDEKDSKRPVFRSAFGIDRFSFTIRFTAEAADNACTSAS